MRKFCKERIVIDNNKWPYTPIEELKFYRHNWIPKNNFMIENEDTKDQIQDLEFDLKHSQHESDRIEIEIAETLNKIADLQQHLIDTRAAHTAELIKRGEIYRKLEYLKEQKDV